VLIALSCLFSQTNAVAAANQQERIDEDKDDAMTALENRTRDTQKMVDTLDALDELKAMSQRNERIGAESLLSAMDERRKREAAHFDDNDEALLKTIKFGGGAAAQKRIEDSDEDAGFVLDELESPFDTAAEQRKKQKKMKKGASEKTGGEAAAAPGVSEAGPAPGAPAIVGGELAGTPALGGALLGAELLKRAAERAAAERLQARGAKLPVLKRKLKAAILPDKAKKPGVAPTAPPFPKPASPGAGGGMLGLAAYGSSDSD